MVAMFIGAIGVLDRTDMDNFPDIFFAYQKLGKETDQREIDKLKASLHQWTSPDSRGKRRAESDNDSFSIKCVGVFDTVGAVGLPEELTHKSPSVKSIFGFPNNELGEHIERAYHALAINETRLDFDCCKFEQTDGGRKKGQILKQIGGGWQDHDLSDMTLAWMMANVGDMLSIDIGYTFSLVDPVAPWGEQRPHNPRTGIFALSKANVRKLPTVMDNTTHETFHPSVLQQKPIDPTLICKLLPLEEELQKRWPYIQRKQDKRQVKGVVPLARSVTSFYSWSFNSASRVRSTTDGGTHTPRFVSL
ncbi:hypothetical protein BDR07DRAFT_1388487 [Suillus spraguei]|nr:hypothetical protein BDR07DRAFT_1388487 [Suillus spraguei]